MSVRARTAVWAAALAGPLLFVPLIKQPAAAFALVIAVVAVALASNSVAWPVGLAGLPALSVALTGSNPLPKGGITLLLFAWAMLAVAFAVARDGGALPIGLLRSPAFVLTALLLCWLVVRLPVSQQPAYASQKLQLFVLIDVAALIGGAVIGRSARDFGLFLRVMLAMGALNAIVLASKLAGGGAQQVAADRYTISSTYDPIAFGRSMGFALLVAVFLLVSGTAAKLRTAAMLALPVLALAFFAAGSRGPLVGLAGGLLVLAALSLGTREARRRLFLLVPVGVIAAFAVTRLVPGQSISRIFSFLTGSGPDSRGQDRLALWHEAWQAFAGHPLAGIGTGSFAAIDPVDVYPHNILLEAASELGLPGLVLVVALLGVGVAVAARVWREGSRRLEASFVLALLALATINAMFSADIAGNNQIWLALGLATGLGGKLGRRRDHEQAPGPSEPEAAPPQQSPPVEPGAVTEPADGATVGGLVRVVASPARTGWGVADLRLQFSRDGGTWTNVPRDDAGYDLVVRDGTGAGHVAVVRSRRLADAVARLLRSSGSEVDLRPARSNPWEHGRRAEVLWDTGGLEPGEYRLRVLTRDRAGSAIPSPAIRLTIRDAQPAGAVPEAAAPVESTSLEPQERALRAIAAAAAERERRLEAEAARLEERRGELESRSNELAERERRLGAEAARLEYEHAELGRAVAEVERERPQLASRGAELDARTDELAERERGLAAESARIAAERVELARAAAELERERPRIASLGAELEARSSELAERERRQEQERAKLAQALAEVERERGLEAARDEHAPPARAEAERERDRAAEAAWVEQALRAPAPAPAPAPVPEPPAVVRGPVAVPAGRLRLAELERLVQETPDPDVYVQEEREATLYQLRSFVEVDATIPPQFDGLVADVFGSLIGWD